MANFLIIPCDGSTSTIIDPKEFDISSGNTYFFGFTGDTSVGCYLVVSGSTERPDDAISSLIPYDDCFDCIKEIPRSASTEVTLCMEICDVSGTTVSQFSPPHPEWTDGYGTQVTQLSMITLGGPNGLNN
jgi:hypothetical protein